MQWCELWRLVAAVDKFVGTRNLIYQGGAGEQRSHRMGFDLRQELNLSRRSGGAEEP